MGLTRRQKSTFQILVDLYRPADPAVRGSVEDPEDEEPTDLEYDPQPVAVDVRCRHKYSQEDNQVALEGRTNYDIVATTDQFHFASDQEIDDGWVLLVKTPGNDYGQTYVSMGVPQDVPSFKRRKPNMRIIFAKKIVRPEQLPAVDVHGLLD